jgi:pimeloyl-ACP methyl ester carboxylesterase
MEKPQIVVIPGAWHGPIYFEKLQSMLEKAGYTIHVRQLASTGNSQPVKSLDDDIALVRSLVEEAIGDGNDVVVVAHSYGGIVAGSALEGLGKAQREAAGLRGGIIRCGYMCAFIVPKGVSIMDKLGGKPLPWYTTEGDHLLRVTDPSIFYSDLAPALQTSWAAHLQLFTGASLYAPTTAASWMHIPTSYLVCEADQAIPAVVQEALIAHVRDEGVHVAVTRVQAGHSPFLSRVEETAAWIQGLGDEGEGGEQRP